MARGSNHAKLWFLVVVGSQKGGIKGEVKRGEMVGERTGFEGERGGKSEEKGWSKLIFGKGMRRSTFQ